MSGENNEYPAGLGELVEKINSLEQRLGRVEEQLNAAVVNLAPVRQDRYQPQQAETPVDEELVMDKGLIESNIFEYGLAWFGSLVLLFGIAFLSNFARNYLNGPLASLVGYGAVAGLFLLAWYLRDSFSHLSLTRSFSWT